MKTFEDVVDLFRSHVSRKRVAVVCPDDESTVGAIRRCVDDKLAEIILVTSGRESRELDEFMAVNSDKVRTVEYKYRQSFACGSRQGMRAFAERCRYVASDGCRYTCL